MSRQFPRFLFSNPKNTKSKGPFIVHTLEPRIIIRVAKVPNYDPGPMTHNGKYILFFLEDYKITKKLRETTDAMFDWIDAQVKAGEIEIPESETKK